MTKNQALLIMDVQNGIVARYAQNLTVLKPCQAALHAARAADIPVIFVRVAFREGYPEVSDRNKSFSAIAGRGGFTASEETTQIHDSVSPLPGEPVVIKRRVSAFSGSDLETLLRARKIDTLVLSGIATSGVILSTLREAADRDYGLVVLSDACLDADPEVHRVLTEKVFVRQAEVMTVEDWIQTFDASRRI